MEVFSRELRLVGAIFELSLCFAPAHWCLPKGAYIPLSSTLIFVSPVRGHLQIAWLWRSVGLTLVVPQDCMYLSSLKAAAWLTGFQQPESRCWLRSFPLGPWQVLVHSQILGVITNKIGCLDNNKGSKDNQELGNSWTIRFLSYTGSYFFKTGRGSCFI